MVEAAPSPRGSISAVITFHRERALATPTLASVERMRRHAEARGWSMELVMTLDGDDAETERAILTHPALREGDTLHRIRVGDLSLSRNHAIAHARGDYVAILDGDDLFSANWISAAVELIEREGPRHIAHPKLIIAFGAWHAWWEQIDQTDPRFLPETLFKLNHWNACSVARREVFLDCPYELARVGDGFGFEDWHWNCQTIARGYVHRVVPETFRLERRKHEGSLNLAHQRHAAVLRPSAFFD
ncbi:MAG: glycosyltransferase [Fulvimonas sp.]|nr:glycosyltransferase [Fulvimonas sp.]